MTLQDSTWNMDTGAFSHLADNTGILTSISNSSIYPSVYMLAMASLYLLLIRDIACCTLLINLFTLIIFLSHLIIKKLIYVRKFTRDNDVSVEFDTYGFSVKDYQTRMLLLRGDSTGDLYPVTQPMQTHPSFALLSSSPTTWQRRLRHPSEDVLRCLESSHLISCNKLKLSALCHACQLGKHTKLPFYSSESYVESVFEVIHLDLWTSPILSESGLTYYAILSDHFSHFVWVYHLHRKFDVFDTFVTFRAYLEPRKDSEGIRGISNSTRRIRGMHIFVGNFTYVSDFMIVEDISSIIDPRLSQVVLGKPFVEISNMTHDLSLGIVKNEEDKRRGVDYVMNKILGFYKECLELGPKYLTGQEEGEGEVNPTYEYYNGSRTSKDNEDPSWNTSFKTKRTQKTTSALEALWKTSFNCICTI
nr:ribonuclease H-like domain-containing protein [Tanacetum cinerariifolium]